MCAGELAALVAEKVNSDADSFLGGVLCACATCGWLVPCSMVDLLIISHWIAQYVTVSSVPLSLWEGFPIHYCIDGSFSPCVSQ